MSSHLNILMVGDVVAKTGRFAVRRVLPGLIADRSIDFVVINGENISGGVGITPDHARDLFDQGANVITTGNHIWRQREIRGYIDRTPTLLRPHNFGDRQPGCGFGVYQTNAGVKVGVMNLAGQVYMGVNADNPFVCADHILDKLGAVVGLNVVLLDFHAEATSEKRAMGEYLDGRVSAVVGTHTHVQTADARVLTKGCAYMTDLGMCGPHDSIIGMRKELVVDRFVSGLPESFKPAKAAPRFQGALFRVDASSGRALEIERIDVPIEA